MTHDDARDGARYYVTATKSIPDPGRFPDVDEYKLLFGVLEACVTTATGRTCAAIDPANLNLGRVVAGRQSIGFSRDQQ